MLFVGVSEHTDCECRVIPDAVRGAGGGCWKLMAEGGAASPMLVKNACRDTCRLSPLAKRSVI